MKRLLYIFTIAVLALTGCQKEDQPTLAQRLQAEWRGTELSADAGIYISFLSDGTFELYQKLSSEGFELRRGTWTLKGDILSGIYNDEEAWAADYKISVNGGKLTMISQTQGNETNVYTKCAIPLEVKRNSTVVVKSR